MTRRANIKRKTSETDISLSLGLDGTGQRRIATPVPFFNHMLEAVARHGLFDLDVQATGDVEVDAHHMVEDVGICLGQAFREALGDRAGITRYGDATIPMDEALVSAAVDFSGRAAFVYRADALKGRWVGNFDLELGREFFGGFVAVVAVQPAPRGALRRERAPHDRGAVQGVRARDLGRDAHGPARGRRAVDQGDADRMSVVVADLGSGNLRSVEKALAAVGADVRVSADPDVVAGADRLVVPGQGAFGACAVALNRGGGALRQALGAFLADGTPVLRHLHRHAAAVRDAARRTPTRRGWACCPAGCAGSPSSRG